MGEQQQDNCWFLPKLVLIVQLCYFHNLFTAEAAGNYFDENFQYGEESSLNLNDRMSQAEVQIKQQRVEISVLKTTVDESREVISQLSDLLANVGESVTVNNEKNNNDILLRQKRPFRLVPVGKPEHTEHQSNAYEFFGSPSSCNELGKIGYTLNGYYLVSGRNRKQFEIVLCQFQSPPGKNADIAGDNIKEERLGSMSVNSNEIGFLYNHPKTAGDKPKDSDNFSISGLSSTSPTYAPQTTEESGEDSSEIINAPTTSTTIKQTSTVRSGINPKFTAKSQRESIESKASAAIALTGSDSSKSKEEKVKSISSNKKLIYHLKNIGEQNNCLAKEQQGAKGHHRLVWFNCDTNRSEMHWIKRVSDYDAWLNVGAFHICHSLDETTCLSVSPNSKSENYFVNLNSFLDDGTRYLRHQQWRLNPKTNQIVNVENGLCLTSFDSKPRSNNVTAIFLVVGVRPCTKGTSVTMEQKWFFGPLQN